MRIVAETGSTVVMVTHDVDEAVLLADRVVMMTNGPAATIGEILEVKFPRPRSRRQLLEDPEYYRLRAQLIGFLEERSHVRPAAPAPKSSPPAASSPPRGLHRFLSALTPA
jgi:ABC-type nitrate/sulfonate/bicarbonate transport system ATPase subunit